MKKLFITLALVIAILIAASLASMLTNIHDNQQRLEQKLDSAITFSKHFEANHLRFCKHELNDFVKYFLEENGYIYTQYFHHDSTFFNYTETKRD